MRITHIIFSIFFLLIIFAPLAVEISVLSPKRVFIGENRNLNTFPELKNMALNEWPLKLEPWLNDIMAFRTQLIRSYIQIWEMELGAHVRFSFLGKKNHTFPNTKKYPILCNYLGLEPLSPRNIANIKLSFAGTQALCLSRGITYLLVFIPDKATLYPELLPFWTQIAKGESWEEQISKAMENTTLNFLNLKPYLEKYKPFHTLYAKYSDTWHWNGIGLAVAYETVGDYLTSLIPSFYPPQYPETTYRLENKKVDTVFGRESIHVMELLKKDSLKVEDRPTELGDNGLSWSLPDVITNKQVNNLSLIFATDSYFKGLGKPRLPGTVGSISPLVHHVHKYIHMHYNSINRNNFSFLEKKYHPNIFIDAFVERASPGAGLSRRDPYMEIMGDILLKTPGYLLSTKEDFSGKTISGKLFMEGNTVKLVGSDSPPLILLPPVTADTEGRAVVMAHLSAPKDTHAKLFFARGNEDFSESNSSIVQIKKGDNLVHCQIFANPNEKVRLRFNPGHLPGEYIFLPMPEEIVHLKNKMKK